MIYTIEGRLFMASLIILLMVIDYFLMRVKHALFSVTYPLACSRVHLIQVA